MKTLNCLLIIIVLLLVINVLFLLFNKSNKTIIANKISLISIALAFVGISFTILDKHFSQYGYNWRTISEYNRFGEAGFDIDEIPKEDGRTPPEYIFCLDVSGSTGFKAKIPEFMKDSVVMYLDENKTLFSDSHKYHELIKQINEGSTYFDLLKLRLMYSIIKLGVIKGDSNIPDKVHLSIVCFSDSSYYVYCDNSTDSSTRIKPKICQTFNIVNECKNVGNNTDFVSLFRFIDSTSLRYVGNRKLFGQKDLVITLFTDYIQDSKQQFKKSSLASILDTINRKNVNLTLYVMQDEELTTSFLRNNKRGGKISVFKMFDSILSESSFQKIDLAENAFLIDYPITSRKPLPIFHKNTIFEDSLSTKIIINRDDSIRVRLWNHYEEDRRTYDLIFRKKDSTSYRLSKHIQTIKVNAEDPIDFNICGYIPSQTTKLPDLVIDDKSSRVRYTIPLAFFVVPPITVIILLAIAIFFLLCVPFLDRKRKKSIKKRKTGSALSITIARSWTPPIK